MSVQEKLITGEELDERRRRLLKAGRRHDSREMQDLRNQATDRDEHLWRTYGKPLIGKHPNEWAAISLDGEVIIKTTASEVMAAATKKFGAGNLACGKRAEFRGRQW